MPKHSVVDRLEAIVVHNSNSISMFKVEIPFFSHTVAEPLYGLGFPRKRYASRTFSCSEYSYGLGGCRYTSDIDPECYNGAHVAGVRCVESKPSFIIQ